MELEIKVLIRSIEYLFYERAILTKFCCRSLKGVRGYVVNVKCQ